MRLLQLTVDGKITFTEFIGKDVPPYAILSHTWGHTNDEVSYLDLVEQMHKSKSGYRKIRMCGEQAKKDGLAYFWVDTCCINKESSAELSEAINSMYAWYQKADICYAFLSDVHDPAKYCNSRWFERGWTLQELLAPADVLFFDAGWKSIDYKTALSSQITRRTGIRESVLLDGSGVNEYSVAERMSWAANRHTSRIEDEAYCLLGLFGVSMPLIYGEGRQAFFRLQEELLRRSDDVSVFAFFSNRPSAPAGPSTFQLTGQGSDITVRESIDLDVVSNTDEEPRLGTVELYAPSPTYFCGAAKFAPYPMIHRMTKQHELPEQPRLRVRRWGHRIKLEAVLWKVPVKELSADWRSNDISVQDAISQAHGVELSLLAIQKLRKYSQAVDMSEWSIAFLDCCNLDGGIMGILLRESMEYKVHVRQHFPSIIETKHAKPFRDLDKIRICTVHVEADTLKATYANITEQTLLQPSSFLREARTENGTIVRATNLEKFGYKLDSRLGNEILDPVCYYTSVPDLPVILLTPQHGRGKASVHSTQQVKQGVSCILFADVEAKSNLQESGSVLLSTFQGSTASLRLRDTPQLVLVLRTHMQWQRNKAWHSYEGLEKRCVLTLSIVELDPALTEDKETVPTKSEPMSERSSRGKEWHEFSPIHRGRW